MSKDKNKLHADLRAAVSVDAIRDWSKDSYIGAACHAWRHGVKSWEVRERLQAFGLHDAPEVKNVHICGEAYSDYQGFIEGALRSAEAVVKAIIND